MTFTVDVERGRHACVAAIDGFLSAVEAMGEYDLLGHSRCHGWSRLEVVVHVIAGWEEMLGGLVSVVERRPTVDAASFWPAFDEEYVDADPVPALMTQRRRAMTYTRPASAVAHLKDVSAAIRRGVQLAGPGHHLWFGHVFTPGDFLAVWAVEGVVHHLDLLGDLPAPEAPLRVARETVEALLAEPLPAAWTDEEAVLVGTGRTAVPDELGHLAARLPALS